MGSCEAVAAGQQEITLATLMTPEGATMAKHILGRVFLDHPYLLPPGLPLHAATALYLTILREPGHRGSQPLAAGNCGDQERRDRQSGSNIGLLSCPRLSTGCRCLTPRSSCLSMTCTGWEALDRSRKRHGFTPDCYAAARR